MKNENPELREEIQFLKLENERLRIGDPEREKTRFELIFNHSALGKKIIDSNLNILKVNKALLNLLGYEEQELLGARIIEFAHPDDRDCWKILQRELWAGEKISFSVDTRLLKKDGTLVWCHVTSIKFLDLDEWFGYTILEDISARIELAALKEKALNMQFEIEKAEIDKANRRESATLVLEAQESERHRIAESLHNGICQLLFGVRLSLDRIKFDQSFSEEHSGIIKHSKNLLNDAIRESRRISHELIPSVLEDYGLNVALEELCLHFTGTLSIKCEINAETTDLDKYLTTAIYRTVQELILNIVKHASASKAHLILARKDEQIVLSLQDNGKGFNKNENSDGIGLKAIRSKVHLLNGTIQIDSKEDMGTRVVISLPVKAPGGTRTGN